MKKISLFVVMLMISIAIFIGCSENKSSSRAICKIKAYEINSTPWKFAEDYPLMYTEAQSYIRKSGSPKWMQTFKYVFVSDGPCEFTGSEYLVSHPADAVDAGDSPYGNSFVIFSNELPDKNIFQVSN